MNHFITIILFFSTSINLLATTYTFHTAGSWTNEDNWDVYPGQYFTGNDDIIIVEQDIEIDWDVYIDGDVKFEFEFGITIENHGDLFSNGGIITFEGNSIILNNYGNMEYVDLFNSTFDHIINEYSGYFNCELNFITFWFTNYGSMTILSETGNFLIDNHGYIEISGFSYLNQPFENIYNDHAEIVFWNNDDAFFENCAFHNTEIYVSFMRNSLLNVSFTDCQLGNNTIIIQVETISFYGDCEIEDTVAVQNN